AEKDKDKKQEAAGATGKQEAPRSEDKPKAPEPPKAAETKDQSAAGSKTEGKVKITVVDGSGAVVREFDGPGAAGVNRTNWDLRWNSPAEPTPEQLEAAAAGFDFGPRGPLVEPGEYTLKIKAGSREQSQKVVVEDDPRIVLSAADRAARREAINQLYAMAKSTDKDRRSIEGLQIALKNIREQWKKDAGKPPAPKIPDDVVKAADELQKKVDALAPKFFREREGLGNAGPPLEWKPDPLPQQVQEL